MRPLSATLTPGLPPEGDRGEFIGRDRHGNTFLLRWSERGHWEALGWIAGPADPMPRLSALAGDEQGLIVGHIGIAGSGAGESPAGDEGAAGMENGPRPADRHPEGVRALGNSTSLSDRERKALAALCQVDGDFAFMSFASVARRSGLPPCDVRRSVRALARKGFAAFGKGLWTDDGTPAGSGYCATEAGRQRMETKPC